MRKLSAEEQNAVNFLRRSGPYTPGHDYSGLHENVTSELRRILDGLVRKKRATVEMTDDGPRYHLTAQGRSDAA